MQHEKRCTKPVLQWIQYVKLTGKYENLKLKYPDPFKCEKIFGIKWISIQGNNIYEEPFRDKYAYKFGKLSYFYNE